MPVIHVSMVELVQMWEFHHSVALVLLGILVSAVKSKVNMILKNTQTLRHCGNCIIVLQELKGI